LFEMEDNVKEIDPDEVDPDLEHEPFVKKTKKKKKRNSAGFI
jgi:hypothetical protein